MNYWPAKDIVKQVMGELGLPMVPTITSETDVLASQFLALLNSCGNELLEYYPWEQFTKEWAFNTVIDKGNYDLPPGWAYFRDQTQWDRGNHWPLLGPKSPQEWAWLKGALIAAFPRIRYRVADNQFMIWPIPGAGGNPSQFSLAMEYVVNTWVTDAVSEPATMVVADGDVVNYNPWMVVKLMKLKFYELKQFSTVAFTADFMRIFNSLTGKDVGNKILSLSPQYTAPYIGPWSIPDGSWNVFGT